MPCEVRDLRRGEWWLNKIETGLLLFGVAFLFLLSVERGWVTPAMRVGLGLAVGGTLLALGLRVYDNRRAFACPGTTRRRDRDTLPNRLRRLSAL